VNILYVGSHSILEYDEVRLFADLGHDVFSIGSYTDPANPTDAKRPAIAGMTYHADLAMLCDRQREKHAGEDTRFYIDYAKSDLHPDLLDWADAIIFAAFPEAWIVPQWPKLRGHRVIWRTIGQSDVSIEQYVRTISGLEIVRYSPAERRAFESIGVFAGEDAMIRFAKYPADWYGWTGEDPVIGNITQDMAGRGEACGYSFWMEATKGLPAKPAGPNSQALPGGIGTLAYDDMRAYLRKIRTYLYTGTQPASYTLGLIEAMMTGVPVVAMPPERFGWPPIFEGAEIAGTYAGGDDDYVRSPDTLLTTTRGLLEERLARPFHGASEHARERAIELFDAAHIGEQWTAQLGSRVAVAA
jgi:glycosyltransferase involved in cell wall biosynthesis